MKGRVFTGRELTQLWIVVDLEASCSQNRVGFDFLLTGSAEGRELPLLFTVS